jgi:glycerol-3-phosphate dehydrogenase
MKELIPLLGGNNTLDYGDFALGGDMIATCFGNSRNKYFGKLVGTGKTPTEAYDQLKEEKKHAEGYETLKGIIKFVSGRQGCDELRKVGEVFSL